MWQDYFGAASRLAFLDIDPNCKIFEVSGVAVEIGDQSDHGFLQNIAAKHGPFDIIIDDGGHKMDQQKASFNGLWAQLYDGGLYVVEDTHTSYWRALAAAFWPKKALSSFRRIWLTECTAGTRIRMESFPFIL